MNDNLCDRCFACAHQVIETFEINEEFNDFKEFKTQILDIIHILELRNTIITEKLWSLNYDFLGEVCSDCINCTNMKGYDFIKNYIKFTLMIKIFELIVNSEYQNKLTDNLIFNNIIKRKMLAFQFNKKGNFHMIRYYRANLIKNDMGNLLNDFKCLDNINEYYEKIYKIPIYLANFDAEQYCERKKLNLGDKIKNHPLVLNKEMKNV